MSGNPPSQTMSPQSIAPVDFNDDLARRCFPYRFRRVGNPYAYLDEIGVDVILEYIYKGHMLIDVAEQTNVPLGILNKWAEHNGHTQRLDEAEILSAEGYLAEGQRRLRGAKTDFELKKAKEMIRHAQFMATKKNRAEYGDQKDTKPKAQMTYVFNIGNNTNPNALKQQIQAASRIIDSTANRAETKEEDKVVKPVTLSLGSEGAQLPSIGDMGIEALRDGDIPITLEEKYPQFAFAHIVNSTEEGIETAPIDKIAIPRPAKPTPDNPDVGPFYEADHPEA